MADELHTQDQEPTEDQATTPSPEAQSAPTPDVKTFTQEEVDAIVGDRLRRDRSKRVAKPEPKPQEAKSNQTLSEKFDQLQGQLTQERRDRVFAEEFSELNVDKRHRNMLKHLVKDEDPADMGERLRQWVSESGLSAASETPTNGTAPTTPEPEKSEQPRSQASDGAATRIPDAARETDIFAMDEDQLNNLGADEVQKRFDKFSSQARSIGGVKFVTNIPGLKDG